MPFAKHALSPRCPRRRWLRLRRWARREPAQALLASGLVLALTLAAGAGGYLLRQRPALRAGAEQIERKQLETMLATSMRSGPGAMNDYLTVDAENMRARAVAAISRVITGEPREALRLVDEAPETSADATALKRVRAAALHRLSRSDEATAIEANLPEPLDELDAYVAGQILLIRGNAAEALRYAARAVRLSDRPQFPYYALLSQSATSSGEQEVARDAIRVLEQRWPEHKLTHLCIGEFHILSPPNYARAAKAYGRAAEIDPDDTLAHAGCAWALLGLGELEPFRRHRNRALELFAPDNIEGRYSFLSGLGMLHRDAGRLDEALTEFEAALTLAPDRFSAPFNAARVMLAMDEVDVARDYLLQALEAEPANPDGLHLWKELNAAAGETAED